MGQVCGVGRGLRWKIKQNKSKFLALSMLGSKLFDIPSYLSFLMGKSSAWFCFFFFFFVFFVVFEELCGTCGGGISLLRQRILNIETKKSEQTLQCLFRFLCLNIKIFTVCAVKRFKNCNTKLDQNFCP